MANLPTQLSLTIREEDGSYWATVAEFPGVFASGADLDELRTSLEEGIALYIEEDGSSATVAIAELACDEPLLAHASAGLEYAFQ